MDERPLSPLALTEEKIEDVCQSREHFVNFFQTYWDSIIHNYRDAEISCHLECEGKHDVMSLVYVGDYHRADILACRGLKFIKYSNANKKH